MEGLASLLMGICIMAKTESSLMTLVASHVGISGFHEKVNRLWESEALQAPAQGLSELRLYSARFRKFVQAQKQAVQRQMVQLYIAGRSDVGDVAQGLSHDIADHYKMLIRDSDTNLQEVRKQNEHLHREVEAFKLRSMNAATAAVSTKVDATQGENERLHAEVSQLTKELEDLGRQLGDERSEARSNVSELERQLQAVATGYEEVEKASAVHAEKIVSLRAAATPLSEKDREVLTARRRVEELEKDRADLLDLLGRVAAECPEAQCLIAPLGVSVRAALA